ncbi:hypothetical protein SDRG_16553 [Saprolegnia diclina VS20]|uniref:Uncharacterized protein n=1 Tax=Saprolegnia diclina (strain VS20) TaxID=1156394 RepID=T0R0T2_SAPDV|nr:hypothetical protein SDRG_16553 [Saprolegnia diclina VS20]EQC25583.1 hypothetical protein SDRG_16553 [Saprolegnia diclina VS20]|eukprot:XP_008620990.1 hypothetical protein SDRG_16553 [Saprolegnia diclina VS20]
MTPESATEGKGTWTQDEHLRFLQAMERYPNGPWKAIADLIATRTIRQTQTHAQKYREKLERRRRGLRTTPVFETALPVAPIEDELAPEVYYHTDDIGVVPGFADCLDFLIAMLDPPSAMQPSCA